MATIDEIHEKRDLHRSRLSGFYAALFDQLCDVLDESGQIYWAPTSSLRSLDEQAMLYAEGRTTKGRIVTNAGPGDSPHNWGCATDFAYFDPSYTNTQDIWNKADWDMYRDAIHAVQGLKWGGDFHSICDRPHNELNLKISWEKIGLIYRTEGEQEAWELIKQNIGG